MRKMLFLAALLACAPATAQTAVAGAAAPEPARLAAARVLLDVMMPPSQRDALFAGMVAATTQNLTAGITDQPGLREVFAREPRAKPVFDRFIARQQERSLASLKASTPAMIDAMARAYARRFTAVQLADLTAFFRTPTGQVYMGQAATIMSDPDVADWQRRAMERSFADLPAEVARLTAELKALEGRAERP